jgi:hypothetical protein
MLQALKLTSCQQQRSHTGAEAASRCMVGPGAAASVGVQQLPAVVVYQQLHLRLAWEGARVGCRSYL